MLGSADIRAAVREALAARGESIAWLSREADVDYAGLHRWLTNKGDLRAETASRCLAALGLVVASAPRRRR